MDSVLASVLMFAVKMPLFNRERQSIHLWQCYRQV